MKNDDSKIVFSNFSFRYQSLKEPTLKNINLEIKTGEKVLIAGRSGSGKSTLIHCLNGIVPFACPGEMSGSLVIDGIEPHKSSISEISSRVGTILQDQDAQFIGLTVAEDIAFNLENHDTPTDDMKKIVNEKLQNVGMHDFSAYSPYELSGGQKQKVSLAGILTSSADILVFDEPLANLDPESGRSTVAFIDELVRETMNTVIIVEHRIEDILEKPIDKLIIIDKGEITACGTPDEVIASGALKQAGLREPLYIGALRHSGCEIKNIDRLSDISACNSDTIRSKIKQWFASSSSARDMSESKGSSPILSVRNLDFSYDGNKKVVDNVSFDIRKGEIISLLGNNGAGKSTLSSLISGILQPSSGDILLGNESILGWGIRRRGGHIGYVMQNPNCMIVKHMIKDEVTLALKSSGCEDHFIENKFADVMKICGLHGFRHWPVNALSYGQKKRVTIASMLMTNPKILIMDEPTAGQDYMTYTKFMSSIQDIAGSGIAVILITHDIHLAIEYTHRSIVMADGRKIADDRPECVLSDSAIVARARLKETSLGRLADMIGIDKNRFIRHFIGYEINNQRGGE